ncbi:MAG: methyltransferase domain-containing protein [Candidatus Schekmanbacteria bacterium]|nr:methyltransferase domain-containing protein [Candidatus Schekmanbacteria bacterium]
MDWKRIAKTLWELPGKTAMVRFQAALRGHSRLQWLEALRATGIAQRLGQGASVEELRSGLAVVQAELLQSFLDYGARIGELRRRGDRYELRGVLARALAASTPEGIAMAGMLEETVRYHGDVFRDLPKTLRESVRPDYLAAYGGVVAQSSRLLFPMIWGYVDKALGGSADLSILEMGCGSGIYLKAYSELGAGLHGVGVDLSAGALAVAQANLDAWGIGDRFTLLRADLREEVWPSALDGPFDVITSYQNVYYFTAAERARLFQKFAVHLAPGGRVFVVSTFSANAPISRYFDVILLASAGCYALPRVEEVHRELTAAGLVVDAESQLVPGQPLFGLVARRP